jgi:hypothetical protein
MGASCLIDKVEGDQNGMAILALRYATPDGTAKHTLFVNGNRVQQLLWVSTGGWDSFTTRRLPVTLKPGPTNSIELRAEPSDQGGISFDKLTIIVPLETPMPDGGAPGIDSGTPKPVDAGSPTSGDSGVGELADAGGTTNGALDAGIMPEDGTTKVNARLGCGVEVQWSQ